MQKLQLLQILAQDEELYKELKNLNVKIINISFERKPNIFVDILTFLVYQ